MEYLLIGYRCLKTIMRVFTVKSFSEFAPSDWHQHQRGIFAGCTLSIILFLAGINIIIEYTLVTSLQVLLCPAKCPFPY